MTSPSFPSSCLRLVLSFFFMPVRSGMGRQEVEGKKKKVISKVFLVVWLLLLIIIIIMYK